MDQEGFTRILPRFAEHLTETTSAPMRIAAPEGLQPGFHSAAAPAQALLSTQSTAPVAHLSQDEAGPKPAEETSALSAVASTEDEAASEEFKPLTPEQAAALKQKLRHVSPWRITAVQAAVGVAAALIGWWATQRGPVLWSMLYGMAAVVLPGGLMAWGLRRRQSQGPVPAALLAVRFMTWELLKIAASAAMLVAAPMAVPGISWPALLVALVLCMKVTWLALLWRGRSAQND